MSALAGLSWMGWGAAAICAAVPFFLYGFAPVFLVRMIALVYPRGHDRRRELPGEMAVAVRYRDRPMWLCEQLALAMTEGLAERFVILRGHRTRASVFTIDWSKIVQALVLGVAATPLALLAFLLLKDMSAIVFSLFLGLLALCVFLAAIATAVRSVDRRWSEEALVVYFLTKVDRREAL